MEPGSYLPPSPILIPKEEYEHINCLFTRINEFLYPNRACASTEPLNLCSRLILF